MELIIIVALVAIFVVNTMMKINGKKIEKMALNPELNQIAKKYPKNLEICKTILKKIGNETTKIEEDTSSEATLYIAIQDKILIGNTHESFTRIQTMIHECLHTIQDRNILIFNFIYSNIYYIYFVFICILICLRKLQNEMIYSNILVIVGFVYYVIRIFLENDAMIRAEYIAKEYIEEQKVSTKEETDKICKGIYDINKEVIKGTNGNIFIKLMIKVVIFNVLALIF